MSYVSLSSLIWSVADLLRGDYKPAEYGKVILPFTVLRRLDCVLAPSKAAVLVEKVDKEKLGLNPEPFLQQITKVPFWNTSPLDLPKLMGDQDNIAANLASYVQAFAAPARDIFERYRFAEQVDRLRKAKLLYQVVERFAGFDLSPRRFSRTRWGLCSRTSSVGSRTQQTTRRGAVHASRRHRPDDVHSFTPRTTTS